MSQRPDRSEYVEGLANYISLVPSEGELTTIFRNQTEEIVTLLSGLSEEQGSYRYAPEKWSIKQVVGHLTDAERIMSYRLLRVARGDTTPLAGFEENSYVENADFDEHSLQELVAHYKLVRTTTQALLDSFPEAAWTRIGTVNSGVISMRAIACLIIGHEQHHLNILKERYLG